MTRLQMAVTDIEIVCTQCRKEWLGAYYGIELCNNCRCESYDCTYAAAPELAEFEGQGRYCEEHYWNFTHCD